MSKDDKKPAFDPSRFAMPSTGAEDFGTRKIRSVIPVYKPGKTEWVHLLDHPDFLIPGTALLDLQDGGRAYVVVPEIAAQLDDDVRLYKLAPGLTSQDKLFLWPCPMIREGETPNLWHTSHNDAFNAAKSGWIRMKSNRACGFYDIIEPEKINPEPDWPDMSFADMLQTAFNDDHIVDCDDHPALRRLKGGHVMNSLSPRSTSSIPSPLAMTETRRHLSSWWCVSCCQVRSDGTGWMSFA